MNVIWRRCPDYVLAHNSQKRQWLNNLPDKYGSKLLEGNVRSFLSTKVAVNKKIRTTILNMPQMFFAFNNGISATAMEVAIENTDHGCFIAFARDFKIINGGQTTASISNARYRDKASLDGLYVQMKLTDIEESTVEEADELRICIHKRLSKVWEWEIMTIRPFYLCETCLSQFDSSFSC